MSQALLFGEVLEAVDQLTMDEQAELVTIVQRRLAEQERKRVLADIEATRLDFAAGRCRTGSAADLIKEIQS